MRATGSIGVNNLTAADFLVFAPPSIASPSLPSSSNPITMSPSGEHSRPWSSVLPLSAPTPHFRRPTETPIGKIQPVFDDFALVDTSWGSDSSFSASTPRFKVPHKTPETKRRRREELYTPAPAQADYSPVPALHEDDLCARRLADLGRRTPLAPLPSEKFQEVAPVVSWPCSASDLS